MFKELISEQWNLLDPFLQKHFGLEDGESISLQGEMTVRHGGMIKLLMPLIRLTGALVPIEGEDFMVSVENRRIGDTFHWHRQFKKDNQVYTFDSKMVQSGSNMIEFVGFGLGLRMSLKVKDGGLIFEDKGYVLKLGPVLIPIPLHSLLGRSYIEESQALSGEDDLNMKFIIRHPWFGFSFSYMGNVNLE